MEEQRFGAHGPIGMMYRRFHVKEGDRGIVTCPGVDFSTNGKHLTIIEQTKTHIAIHVPGGSFWSGRNTSYGPARIYVYEVLERGVDGEEGYYFVGREIISPIVRVVPKEFKPYGAGSM